MARNGVRLQTARIKAGVDPSATWTVRTEYKAPSGRTLEPGTEVKIIGERGRFRFVKYVQTEDGTEWLDFVGGKGGHECFRAFRPDRIKTVHRIQKTRANLKP